MLALALATVKIGVFGALHPVLLEVRPAAHTVLVVHTQARSEILNDKHVRTLNGNARVTGRGGAMARFVLSIPGGMRREYYGRLETRRKDGAVQAVVEMNIETAVASIVAAESSIAVPFEARKAQAVATRSYLMGALGRHVDFDFCDAAHCQLMQGPRPSDITASRAAHETEGQVLTYHGQIVPTLYSANCGGHTKTLVDAGWHVMNYPFHSVACARKGAGSGHGVGLCQLGALDMAKRGADYREILAHYMPKTTLETLEASAPQPITGGRGSTFQMVLARR